MSHGRATTEQQEREGDFSLVDALTIMLERGASDLHLTTGAKPTIRLSGSLVALDDFPVLTPPVIQRVMYAMRHPGASARSSRRCSSSTSPTRCRAGPASA